MSKTFDKEEFKERVKENVKTLYRKTIKEATQQQLFQAVSYAVKDDIINNWLATQKQYEIDDPKTVYYMSMEFLMGRALGNNLINLCAYKEVKEALDEMGFDLNVIEDQEPDAALGNGGLGRLAACFLDSLATLGYSAYGCGIRYRYGMFKQKIENGYQVEVPDNWLKDGNPFELRRPEYAKIVKFGGYVRVEYDEEHKKNNFVQEGYQSVRAIPYDIPVLGYNNNIVNTLRVWDAEAINDFHLDSFDKGDYQKAVEQENLAKNIVDVLYPNDNHYAGKELRLKQQYFFISASVQAAIAQRFTEVDRLSELTRINTDEIRRIKEIQSRTANKIGIVKYDAFPDVGGRLSFALAMLDENNSGFVLNAIHGREGCYTYVKEIVKGESYVVLGQEEKEALRQAVNYFSDMQ